MEEIQPLPKTQNPNSNPSEITPITTTTKLKPSYDPFIKKFSEKCHFHGLQIEYFCETCNEIACE